MAAGVSDLSGRRVGLLHNNKRGAREFLEHLAELLSTRYRGITFVRSRKLDATSVCPPETLDDLVARTDLVITAVGD